MFGCGGGWAVLGFYKSASREPVKKYKIYKKQIVLERSAFCILMDYLHDLRRDSRKYVEYFRGGLFGGLENRLNFEKCGATVAYPCVVRLTLLMANWKETCHVSKMTCEKRAKLLSFLSIALFNYSTAVIHYFNYRCFI